MLSTLTITIKVKKQSISFSHCLRPYTKFNLMMISITRNVRFQILIHHITEKVLSVFGYLKVDTRIAKNQESKNILLNLENKKKNWIFSNDIWTYCPTVAQCRTVFPFEILCIFYSFEHIRALLSYLRHIIDCDISGPETHVVVYQKCLIFNFFYRLH